MKTQFETRELHELFHGRLKIIQKKGGYRFSVDSILLACFAAERASGAVADLGTGCGVLPVILAKRRQFDQITGIEIQHDLARLARENVSFNNCDDNVTILNADIKKINMSLSAETFDAVITNPPFYPVGTGRINPDPENAGARHELYAVLRDFISAAAFLLKQSGKFYAVYLSSRTVDLIEEMRKQHIEPKIIRFVHSKNDEPATMVLVEGVKRAGVEVKILPPLFLYDNDGKYTEEAKAVFSYV
jgi:tRNA1Val (adenine37-N6)-methyltransferase